MMRGLTLLDVKGMPETVGRLWSACQTGWCCVTVPATPTRHCGLVPVFVTHHGCSAQRVPPASGDAREVASVPGAVVPPWDVPARAPGRQNVPGGVPRLSLPPQGGGHVSSGPTRSRSRTPTTSNSKKPTLSCGDKARGRCVSPRGNEWNRGSPHASELDEMRRANEQLRKENAQIKQ
ncbi:hypothetical protein MRX96_024601 [Rhipicephalus microplus]